MTRKNKQGGTNNVLADLGFPDAEALTAKALVAKQINDILEYRRLTQINDAALPGIPQPKMSAVRNYKLGAFRWSA